MSAGSKGWALAHEEIWPETHLRQPVLDRLAKKDGRIPYYSQVQKEAKWKPTTTPAALRNAAYARATARHRQAEPAARD